MAGTAGSVRRLPSRANAAWLLGGAGASLAAHPSDKSVSRRLSSSENLDRLLSPGNRIGSAAVQFGAATALYSIGLLARSPCAGVVGADILRAQLLAEALTFAVKYTGRRERPDEGAGYSFPSGHTSVAFAAATVLHERFGRKVGVPAYAVASYVAAARIQARRHYLSDVVFGAVVGIVSGHAATLAKERSIAIAPAVSRSTAGIVFVWTQ